MAWDTRELHQTAADKFQGIMSSHQRGKELLDEIAEITETLRKMGQLEQVTICSCNDSHWRPKISTDEIKRMVTVNLEKRRTELRNEFNRIFV